MLGRTLQNCTCVTCNGPPAAPMFIASVDQALQQLLLSLCASVPQKFQVQHSTVFTNEVCRHLAIFAVSPIRVASKMSCLCMQILTSEGMVYEYVN